MCIDINQSVNQKSYDQEHYQKSMDVDATVKCECKRGKECVKNTYNSYKPGKLQL